MENRRYKIINMIIYIICMGVALYGYPAYAFYDSIEKGYDTGETAMGLFFFMIPIMLAVIIFVYTLMAGELKKALIIEIVMFTPWLFMGVMEWLAFEVPYLLGAALIGGLGWLIHNVIAGKMIEHKAKQADNSAESEDESKSDANDESDKNVKNDDETD